MKIKRIKPGPDQESVWDYPRPPKLEQFNGHIRIIFNEQAILNTNRAIRILETSHPPTFYLPIADFQEGVLHETDASSYCEFKGAADYYDLVVNNKKVSKAAWGYKKPSASYQELQDKVAVYAHLVDACFVNDELVQAQEGDFYGGWITNSIVGPFKGALGTWGW